MTAIAGRAKKELGFAPRPLKHAGAGLQTMGSALAGAFSKSTAWVLGELAKLGLNG